MANKRKGSITSFIVIACLGIAGIAWLFYTVKSAAPPLPATPMPVVFNTQWNGSVWQVTDWLEKNAHNEQTLKVLHWGKVEHVKDEYMVRVKFSTENKAGVAVVSDKVFMLDEQGDIVGVADYHRPGTH